MNEYSCSKSNAFISTQRRYSEIKIPICYKVSPYMDYPTQKNFSEYVVIVFIADKNQNSQKNINSKNIDQQSASRFTKRFLPRSKKKLSLQIGKALKKHFQTKTYTHKSSHIFPKVHVLLRFSLTIQIVGKKVCWEFI